LEDFGFLKAKTIQELNIAIPKSASIVLIKFTGVYPIAQRKRKR